MIQVLNPFKVSVAEEMQRNPELKMDDIKHLQEWLLTQPHLPEMCDEQLCQFIHACYYDIEQTKITLQYFFTYKSSMMEFFTGWDPASMELCSYVDSVLCVAVLPKQSPDDQQILVLKLNDTTPRKYDFAMSVKWLIMTVSRIQMEHGTQTGFILVYDAMGYTISHVFRNSMSSVQNYIQFGKNAGSIRVTEIHFINSNLVVKSLISVIKPFLDKELMKMISFHTTSHGFFKNIPTTRIPVDYGGMAQSMQALHKDNIKKMQNIRMEIIGQERLCAKDVTNMENLEVAVNDSETSFQHLEFD